MRSLILASSLMLVACATGGPGNGSIAIETASRGQSLAGANCHVRNNAGNWDVVTPAMVGIGGVDGDLHVVCDKTGYRTSEFVFKPSNGSYSGSSVGLGIGGGGGHVGVGIGMSVPIASGRGGYPSRITVDMNPQ